MFEVSNLKDLTFWWTLKTSGQVLVGYILEPHLKRSSKFTDFYLRFGLSGTQPSNVRSRYRTTSRTRISRSTAPLRRCYQKINSDHAAHQLAGRTRSIRRPNPKFFLHPAFNTPGKQYNRHKSSTVQLTGSEMLLFGFIILDLMTDVTFTVRDHGFIGLYVQLSVISLQAVFTSGLYI